MTMRTTIAAGVTLAVLATSACGVPDLIGGGDEEFTVTAGLAQLPQPEGDEYMVRVVDLDAATEAAGLKRPTDLDPESISAWMAPLSGQQSDGSYAPVLAPMPELTNPKFGLKAQEFHDIAGWSTVDISSYAEVIDRPRSFASLTGDFDDSTLDHLPEVGDGVRTVGEGEDGEGDLARTTVVQPTGAPVRMAQRDGRLGGSSSTAAVEDWLDGPEMPLSDDPTMSSLADALDEQDAVSAQFAVGGDFSAGTTLRTPRAADHVGPLPEHAFDAVAIGWLEPDGGPRLVVAYHFSDEGAAESSVDPIKEVFASGRDMYGRALSDAYVVDKVTADGPVVTAILEPQREGAQVKIQTRLQARDAPFLHQ